MARIHAHDYSMTEPVALEKQFSLFQSVTLERSGRVPNPGFYGALPLQNDWVGRSQ